MSVEFRFRVNNEEASWSIRVSIFLKHLIRSERLLNLPYGKASTARLDRIEKAVKGNTY